MAHMKCHGVQRQVLRQWRALMFRYTTEKLHVQRLHTNAQEAVVTSSTPSMQRDESSQWKKPIPIQSALIQQPCGTDLLQSYLSIGEYTAAWQVFDTLVKDLSHLSSTNARQLLVLLHNDVLQLPSDPRLVIMWTKRLQSLWLQSNRWSHDDIAAAIESYGRLGKLAHAEALYATIDPHSKTKTSSHSTLTTTIANKMLGAYLRQWKYSDTHQQQQYLDRMLVIFDSMVSPRTRKKKRPVADIVTYNHILAAHIKMNNWESAERWFLQVMVPSGLHFKRTTFHMLLQGAIRHHQRPQQWIEHMANAGLRPNRQTFKHILLGLASQATHFARVQQWYGLQTTCTSLHECFDIMQKWKYKPSTLLVNAMLSTALLANHESLANELLSRLGLLSSLSVPHQCHPDVATFNILVHHALCQTNLPLAESWYQRMRHEFDLRPDYVTYGMLINHHLQHREIDVALQYLDDMARHGLEPNTVINNMLWKARDHLSISMRLPTQPLDNIVACNQSLSIAWQPNDEKGTLERLDGVVKAMAAHNLTPNQRTINTTLDIHGKLLAEIMASHTPVESEPDDDYSLFETSDVDISNGGKRQSPAALSLQDIGIKESPTADTITYALRIRNAVYQQDLPKAEATLRAMSDAGVLPNSFVFAHLVHGYAQQGLLNKAHSILHLMNQAPYHVKPTSHVFAPLVDAYSKAGDVDKAHRLFKDMTDIGIEPDVPMYTILARLFVKHGSPLEAIQVLRDLPLDTHAQGVLMEAYGKVAQFVKKSSRQEYIQLVQKLYVSMPEHAMVDTIYLTALGRLGSPELAYQHWLNINEPSLPHYNALLGALVKDKSWYRAMQQIFSNMALLPDATTLNFMVQASDMQKDYYYIANTIWPRLHTNRLMVLAKTYYLVMRAMVACGYDAAGQSVYDEFTKVQSFPTSATLWIREIQSLASVHGWTPPVPKPKSFVRLPLPRSVT